MNRCHYDITALSVSADLPSGRFYLCALGPPSSSFSVSLLEQSLHYSHTFCGGGCTEAVLSNFLEKEVCNNSRIGILHVKPEFPVDRQMKSVKKCSMNCNVISVSHLILSMVFIAWNASFLNSGTYRSVMRNAANSFAVLASSLEHFGGLSVTDSVYHHCWSFPPHDYCEAVFADDVNGKSGDFPAGFEGKTCCCGAVKLSDLQARCSCKWQTLTRHGFSPIPEAIQGLLSKAQSHDGLTCETGSNASNGGVHGSTSSPVEANFHGNSLSKSRTSQSPGEVADDGDADAANLGIPDVCEAFLPKLKAVELAGDLVCTVLRIAYVVSERM